MPHNIKTFVTDVSRFTTQNYTDFAAEASAVGLPPGVWPESLIVRDGEKEHVAEFKVSMEREGEIDYGIYVDADGVTFKVYND